MFTDTFEVAFDSFINSQNYDTVEQVIFDFARSAFIAGWTAAKQERILHVLPQKPREEPHIFHTTEE